MDADITAEELLQFITQVLYVLVFIRVAVEVYRRPRRVTIDIALFFGALALVIASQWLNALLHPVPEQMVSVVNGSLVMVLPYLLLRLVEDFADVPRWIMVAAAAGMIASIATLLVVRPLPVAGALFVTFYFFAFIAYAAAQFTREARRSTGVTRRRMQAAAAGSGFLALAILFAGFQTALPSYRPLLVLITRSFSLASGVGYLFGFAPPSLLRRAWQEPELRAFLSRAAYLPRLPTTREIVLALERGAAASTGAPQAIIGLWQEAEGVLRYYRHFSLVPEAAGAAGAAGAADASTGDDGEPREVSTDQHDEVTDTPPDRYIAGKAFTTGRPIFTDDALRDDPENSTDYTVYGSTAVLAAPIAAGERRLGVLVVYSPRAPIFAEDDLVLVQLLADQAAVVLESRALIDEAARMRAREEVVRLRDDFLSAAAHDLKTPLTTLLAQAQLIERRLRRDPTTPVDLASIERIVNETRRLSALVVELLDAARAEQGRLVGHREPVDLSDLARTLAQALPSPRHEVLFDAPAPVWGRYDRARIAQLISNLLENAVKYSPAGGPVTVRVWQENGTAHLTVTDHGIGIPPADLPHVFDRFHRGSNVDDRRFAGMGLGLFICHAIVEGHEGRISVASTRGSGTTFEVTLPALAEAPAITPAGAVAR